MSRSEIIQKILIRLDEIGEFEEEYNSLQSLADNLLDESANELLLLLPFHLLPLQDLQESPTQIGRHGSISVPINFLRLGKFKMEGWERPVLFAYNEGTEMANRQYNTSLMGGVSKPVVVFSNYREVKKLFYYSLPEGATHTVTESSYVKTHEGDELDDFFMTPLTWLCASKVMQVTNNNEEMQLALSQVNNWIKQNS